MATTFIQEGCVLEFAAPTGGVVSGTPLLIGSLVVIPLVTAAQTIRFNAAEAGVFTVPKATGAAWTEGQILYFDSTAGNFATAQSATARRAGVAIVAAASGDTTGIVKLKNIGAAVNVA
jgi:predicted RecA/RadA family phage recombinase